MLFRSPVAWKVLKAGEKEAWHPHWCRLLSLLRQVVPDGWTVVVLTDRGLESARLFRAICGLGFHPLMRAKAGGTFRPAGWHKFYPLGAFATRAGPRFAAAGAAYAREPLACTLRACLISTARWAAYERTSAGTMRSTRSWAGPSGKVGYRWPGPFWWCPGGPRTSSPRRLCWREFRCLRLCPPPARWRSTWRVTRA